MWQVETKNKGVWTEHARLMSLRVAERMAERLVRRGVISRVTELTTLEEMNDLTPDDNQQAQDDVYDYR